MCRYVRSKDDLWPVGGGAVNSNQSTADLWLVGGGAVNSNRNIAGSAFI